MVGYEDEDVRIEIKDGIMWSTIKKGVVIDQKVGSKIIRERIKFSKGKSYPLLSDSLGAKYWTLYSRNKDMTDQTYYLVTCIAIVLPTEFAVKLWDSAAEVSPPTVPIKLFFDLEEAEAWLKLQMI